MGLQIRCGLHQAKGLTLCLADKPGGLADDAEDAIQISVVMLYCIISVRSCAWHLLLHTTTMQCVNQRRVDHALAAVESASRDCNGPATFYELTARSAASHCTDGVQHEA